MEICNTLKCCENEQEIIRLYDKVGLFFSGVCPHCNQAMYEKIGTSIDETKFICLKDKIEIYKKAGTIFQDMRISYKQFNKMLLYYSMEFSPKQIYTILGTFDSKGLCMNTVRKYLKIFRKVTHYYVQKALTDLVLTGEIEIDEACLYRIRKGRNGRIAKTIYWVFGMKERHSKKLIIYPVLYRTRIVILPIIQRHIAPGSTIYSDRFSVYFNNRTTPPTSILQPLGYKHYGINHSLHFVSNINRSINTNTIERVWRSLKEKFRNHKPRLEIDKHISEFMFEAWVKKEDKFAFLLNLIKISKIRSIRNEI